MIVIQPARPAAVPAWAWVLIGLAACPLTCLGWGVLGASGGHHGPSSAQISVQYVPGSYGGSLGATVTNKGSETIHQVQGVAMYGTDAVTGHWTDGEGDYGTFIDIPPGKKAGIIWEPPNNYGLKPSLVRFAEGADPIEGTPNP